MRSATHLDLACTSRQPASVACSCAPQHVPSYAAFSRDGALPNLPSSYFTQVPVSPWGFFPLWVPPRFCVPALPSLGYPPNTGIVRSLVSCLVDFRASARGQGASIPWQSRVPVLSPPATWSCCQLSGYLSPPSPPPSPSPPCRHDPILVDRISVGHKTRSRCYERM